MADRNRDREEMRRRDQERRRDQARAVQRERDEKRKAFQAQRKKQQDELKKKMKLQREAARKAKALAAANAPKKPNAFVTFMNGVFRGVLSKDRRAEMRAERRRKFATQQEPVLEKAPANTPADAKSTQLDPLGGRQSSPEKSRTDTTKTVTPPPPDKGFM
jgi:hypothetical protein